MNIKNKTLPQLIKHLRDKVHEYVRLRDNGKPCISCGEYKVLEAGHYYSANSYNALRFDFDNIHGECIDCNRFDNDHLVGYSENLPRRIGQKRFENLKMRAKMSKRGVTNWAKFELIQKIQEVNEMLRELK